MNFFGAKKYLKMFNYMQVGLSDSYIIEFTMHTSKKNITDINVIMFCFPSQMFLFLIIMLLSMCIRNMFNDF